MMSSHHLLASLVVVVAQFSLWSEGAVLDAISPKTTNDFTTPSFTIAELQAGSRTNDLIDVLATTGILSVTGTTRDQTAFASTRHNALLGLCECMATSSKFVEHVTGSDTVLLEDGTTRRTTLATATVGSTPLSLHAQELQEAGCSDFTVQSADALRDHVAWVSHVFVQALDKVITNQMGKDREALLESLDGTAFVTLASIVKASHNLEHFHVYDKPLTSTEAAAPVLDVHTDAGLFLAFVPGMSCDSTRPDESNDFYVQTPHGGPLERAAFPPGSVTIMLGAGAEHWLHALSGPESSLLLRATRHAVTMPAGNRRAWYGMMHTVPADAIIQDFPKRTFGDMKRAMVLSGATARTFGSGQSVPEDHVSIGCGSSVTEATRHGATRINRRRMQMVSDASVCNNVTNFFCWMSCLDIPEADKAVGFITEGYSLYCLDPGTLAKTGNKVSAAQEVCNDVQNDFCYGGTSMYMDGFHWTDPTCVIYLFPSWVLKSAGSLAGACIGTIAFSVGLEAVIWKRRSVVPAFPVGWKRMGASTLFYGVQLTMGYLLMLVVMIYSGPLFFSVIVGLMIGHALFNAGDIKAPKPRTSDDLANGGKGTEKNDSSDGLERADGSLKAPEGLTPCCQNTV